MSVKHALLALLSQEPKYGYQLRAEFEQRTGAAWPLNVGQVYQTLNRLERDGLAVVVAHGGGDDAHEPAVPQDAANDRGHVSYAITDAGRAEVDEWFASAVPRTSPPRDELAIKLAIAVTIPGVDIAALVQQQRHATMSALQSHMRARRIEAKRVEETGQRDEIASLAQGLVLDSLVFDAESELRWLDHCETRLHKAAALHAENSVLGGI